MKRYASVIQLNPDDVLAYKQLHQHTWQGVLDTIRACNIRNYSIFLHEHMLYAYYEYVGSDHAADLQKMAQDPVTQAWWRLTAPMQTPVPQAAPNERWHELAEVFHTD